ncbi:Uncharacterised protein [Raoultella ornithinolytica]|nr:hypothetical protein ROGSH02058M1_025020 [Raoultella ornithinolytica]SBL33992.1 Uncharacterised protein [Raoultella ornithinolytica]
MTISPQKLSGRLGLKLVSGFPANNEFATHYQTQHSLPFTILTSKKFHSFPTISVAGCINNETSFSYFYREQ